MCLTLLLTSFIVYLFLNHGKYLFSLRRPSQLGQSQNIGVLSTGHFEGSNMMANQNEVKASMFVETFVTRNRLVWQQILEGLQGQTHPLPRRPLVLTTEASGSALEGAKVARPWRKSLINLW
jgi:hypothetical protein